MIIKKYKELIRHIEKHLADEDEKRFAEFIKEMENLEKVALEAAEILEEVRTGEDFECVCHQKAGEVRKALGLKCDWE